MERVLTIVAALLCLIFSAAGSLPAVAGTRVALVIGNSVYKDAHLSLANPKNDAQDVSGALKRLGFSVITATDLDLPGFEDALGQFKASAKDAEIALFYYAGHAVQFEHVNYFIPTDAVIDRVDRLKHAAISMDEIQDALSGVQGVQVLILDSCRDNPFTSLSLAARSMSVSRGIERIQVGSGDSVILYSTRANEVALDGVGTRNSPFSSVLVDTLKQPGRHELGGLLRQVAAKVKSDTGGKQSPELTMSISGDYFLDLDNDRLEWDTIKDSLDPAVFRAFIDRFPDSTFRRDAERRAQVYEDQEAQRRKDEKAEKQRKDDKRRRDQEASLKAICTLSQQYLDAMVTGRDQAGLERFSRDNACPALKDSIAQALASVGEFNRRTKCERADDDLGRFGETGNRSGLADLKAMTECPGLAGRATQALADLDTADRHQKDQAEAQRRCEADAASLETLRLARRIDAIAALGATASCDTVRGAASALATTLRAQDEEAANEARQAAVCKTETDRAQSLVLQGPRSALEELGRAHTCPTLDVGQALARYDDLVAQRQAQALAACAATDIAPLRSAGDTKGLADLLARCPSRKADVDGANVAIAEAARQTRLAAVCVAEDQRLQGLVVAGPRAAIEAINRAHDCPTLAVGQALARYDDLVAQRALAACAAVDIAPLRAAGDTKGLGDLAARCPSRKGDADVAIVAVAETARQARQAAACTAEDQRVQGLVVSGPRAAIEALGRSHDCSTLDIGQALARYDDLVAQRAVAACAAVDVAPLRAAGDTKGLGDLAARCPSRKGDTDVALATIAETARQTRQAAVCAAEDKRVQGLMVSGSRAAIEEIGRTHQCPTLDVGQALARYDDLVAQRTLAACAAVDVAPLRAAGDVKGLGDLSARCPSRKGDVTVAVAAIAEAARQARQATVCAAEDKRVQALVAQGPRAAIEAMGQTHECPTLDVGQALARYDDRVAQQQTQALATCAAVDIAPLRAAGDTKGLGDLAARCPSRKGDTDAALASIAAARHLADVCQRETTELQGAVTARRLAGVTDLQQRAQCPGLDFSGATRQIAKAACDLGIAAVGRIAGTDEAALRGQADEAALCDDARKVAAGRLDALVATRAQDDATCDTAIADAGKTGDAGQFQRLAKASFCARRQTVLAQRLDEARAAETTRLAQARCDAGVKAVGAIGAADETALRGVVSDAATCEGARVAARDRLGRLLATRDDEDKQCDASMADAAGHEDIGGLGKLAATPSCLRRRTVIADRIGGLKLAEQDRTGEAQRRLTELGCYAGKPSGAFDDATKAAVGAYRRIKHEDGAAPIRISADFLAELAAQHDPVCVVASLEAPKPAVAVPGRTAPVIAPTPARPAAAKPAPAKAAVKPVLRRPIVPPEPAEPEQARRPARPRVYAEPAPAKVRPTRAPAEAAAPRAPHAAPPVVAEPQPHIFY